MTPQDYKDILELIARIVVTGGVLTGICVLIPSYRSCPKSCRWHFITATVWMLITGIQTASLIQSPSDNSLIKHFVVFVAGMVLIPSWAQLVERRRESLPVKRRLFPARWFVQTLWGPLVLWMAVSGIQYSGQRQFKQAVERHDLPTAILLRDCGLGDPYYIIASSDDEDTRLDIAVQRQDVQKVATYLAVGEINEFELTYSLALAVKRKNSMITELLLEYDGSANEKVSYGSDPLLCQAVEAGRENQVRVLLRHGANRKSINSSGETAFQIARHSGNKDIVDLLATPAKPKAE